MTNSKKQTILIFRPGETSLIGLYRPWQSEEWVSNPVIHSKTENRLLTAINELLSSSHLTLQEITSVGISPGPASYGEIRLAVATANALAWILKLPFFSYPAQTVLPDDIPKYMTSARVGVTVEPIYPASLG
jgi:tRNA A37 threonylcarbamoyladenosine modification protein TsaB